MTVEHTNVPPNIPQAHSEFSPSGSGRWLACPGSIQAIRSLNLVRGKSNFYALEGSVAHEIASECLIDTGKHPEDYIGQTITLPNEDGILVTKEMTDAVDIYVDHVLAYRTPTNRMRIEEKVSLEFLTPGMFGTADAIVIDEDVLRVIDYKHGKGVAVDVHKNSQLMTYGLGTVMMLIEEGFDISKIRVVELQIVQPRCPHPDGSIRVDTLTIDDLKKHSKRCRKAIKNACSTDPWFEAGEKQCQWCDFAPMCKHLAEFNLRLATNEFSEFASLEEDFKPTNFKEANSLSDKEISIILQNSSIIQNWIKRMLAYAQDELEHDRPIPNYKLVRGRSNRVWKDGAFEDVKLECKMAIPDLTDEDFINSKNKTPAMIEKMLGKKKKIIEGYFEKPLGKVTIAHITDKRPAVSPDTDAKNDFAEFAEEIPNE